MCSDPGVGPHLQYKEVNTQVNLSCKVEEVFPEPELVLDWYHDLDYQLGEPRKEQFNDKYR